MAAAARPRAGRTTASTIPRSRRPKSLGERSRALRSRRQRRPRTAADPRADAGAGEARDRSRHVRGDLDDAAARQRALRGRPGRRRARASRSRAIRTIGAAISAVNRGFWNFDEIRFDYYRDANSYHEAFKKGLFDVRKEDDPGRWQTAYDFPALRDGRVVKETLHLRPAEAELQFRVQHAPRDLRRHPRARGDRAAVRLRMGQPLDLLRSLPPQRELSSRAPSFPRAAARPMRASARCSRRFPTRCAPTCSTAPGRRP